MTVSEGHGQRLVAKELLDREDVDDRNISDIGKRRNSAKGSNHSPLASSRPANTNTRAGLYSSNS